MTTPQHSTENAIKDEIASVSRHASLAIQQYLRMAAHRIERQRWQAHVANQRVMNKDRYLAPKSTPDQKPANAANVQAASVAALGAQWAVAHYNRDKNPEAAQKWDQRLQDKGINPAWVKERVSMEQAHQEAAAQEQARAAQSEARAAEQRAQQQQAAQRMQQRAHIFPTSPIMLATGATIAAAVGVATVSTLAEQGQLPQLAEAVEGISAAAAAPEAGLASEQVASFDPEPEPDEFAPLSADDQAWIDSISAGQDQIMAESDRAVAMLDTISDQPAPLGGEHLDQALAQTRAEGAPAPMVKPPAPGLDLMQGMEMG